MRKSKLWKRPYHSGIDWSAENEAKAFGFPSHAAFVEEMLKRMKEPVKTISLEDLIKKIDDGNFPYIS